MQIFTRPMFLVVDNCLFMAGFSKYSANPYNMTNRTATYAECRYETVGLVDGLWGECGVIEWRAGETDLFGDES